MKIAVNENIMNIGDIYHISKIEKYNGEKEYYHYYSGYIYLFFVITLYGGTKMFIQIDTYTYWDGINYCEIKNPNKNTTIVKNDYNGTLKQCEDSEIYKSQLKKITDARQGIIDIWSNHQKDIPKFSTETIETEKTEE